MEEIDPTIAGELAALKAAFRERLADDLAAFSEALGRPGLPAASLERLRPLAARAHRLAGAAGGFDEAALSEAARRFEELCAPDADDGEPEAAAQALYQLVLELERVVDAEG